MPDERTERIALNESRLRKINDDLRSDLAKLPHEPDVIPFVCECGEASCAAIVELTVPEYEAIRANSRRFMVIAGHEKPDVEYVVGQTSGHSVVEKRPESGPLVDATGQSRAGGRPSRG